VGSVLRGPAHLQAIPNFSPAFVVTQLLESGRLRVRLICPTEPNAVSRKSYSWLQLEERIS